MYPITAGLFPITMFWCKVAVVVLLLGFSSATSNNQVPEPVIQVFYPRGLFVSVDDIPGITVVLIHVNIIRKSATLDDKSISQYVRRKHDGKWTVMKRHLRVNIGDTITYSVFVVRDGKGFVSAEGECQVEELLYQRERQLSANKNQSRNGNCKSSSEPLPQPVTEAPETIDDTKYYLSVCEETIINSTRTLISFQSQVSQLRKMNEQLMNALGKYPNAKQLTINGRIPPDGSPTATVGFLLREKLDLNPHILSAVRNADGSITFEVETITEKIEILEVAKEKLLHSKIVIN